MQVEPYLDLAAVYNVLRKHVKAHAQSSVKHGSTAAVTEAALGQRELRSAWSVGAEMSGGAAAGISSTEHRAAVLAASSGCAAEARTHNSEASESASSSASSAAVLTVATSAAVASGVVTSTVARGLPVAHGLSAIVEAVLGRPLDKVRALPR